MGYGIRLLLRNPGFTFVAVMTLATGIGTNCLVFSVVDSVLLRPFPYPQPGRLTLVWGVDLTSGSRAMLLATLVPARRATRVDPVIALRYE